MKKKKGFLGQINFRNVALPDFSQFLPISIGKVLSSLLELGICQKYPEISRSKTVEANSIQIMKDFFYVVLKSLKLFQFFFLLE